MLPDERLEMLLASIATLVANQWRGEDDEPATPMDFMPWLERESDDVSDPERTNVMVEMLKQVFGAQEVKDDGSDQLDGLDR